MAVVDISNKARSAQPLDVDEVRDWRKDNVLGEFRALVMRPPLRSLVVDIHPEAAAMLLCEANTKNRPRSQRYVAVMAELFDMTQAGVTGDTIKVGESGVLLDGQHRLEMATKARVPFRTHIVFGLDDAVFDILDQGRRRTGGDVLAIELVPNYMSTASAVRWIYILTGASRSSDGGGGIKGGSVGRFIPRSIGKLVRGPFSELPRYAVHGSRVSKAYKFPNAMVQALTFLVAQHDPKMAERFIHDWVSGSRDGANKTFDNMQARLNSIRSQNAGRVSRMILAAFAVVAFNYWKQGQVAPLRAFVWHKGLAFPKIAVPLPKLP